MQLNSDGTKPIYVQIAEWLENEIIAEHLKSDDKVYSQYQLAELFNINPATAGKGLTLLLEKQIVYKKRGLGMFVTAEAKKMILEKRRNDRLTSMIQEIVLEAKRLMVSEDELITLIKRASSKEEWK